MFPQSNDDSVLERAQISKAVSSRLLSRAKTPQAGGQELRAALLHQQRRVTALEETVREAAMQDNGISRDLQKLDNLKGKPKHNKLHLGANPLVFN